MATAKQPGGMGRQLPGERHAENDNDPGASENAANTTTVHNNLPEDPQEAHGDPGDGAD